MSSYRFDDLVVGGNTQVSINNGLKVKYVHLDNAATTPPFKRVMEKINEFSNYYSSVHRGSGYKSVISTEVYNQCRETLMEFVNADKEFNTAIFLRNSTEALNMAASIFDFKKKDVVICSRMEHHSNDLPWREHSEVKHIEINEDGSLNLNHLEALLREYENKVKLVAVTGASNVTGFINPIYEIAKLCHRFGTKILVDASQLAPHRKIDMRKDYEEEHLDFLVFTGHKLYAPFGAGVIIGPKAFFNNKNPFIKGGGIVKLVTDDKVYFENTPERNEAGTPNLMGAVALGSAIKQFEEIGIENIENHEQSLTAYLLQSMRTIDKIKIYGSCEADRNKRLGVVSFNLEGVPHALIAAILSYEYGIGVRNGCFCAHPYVLRLLKLNPSEIEVHKLNILDENKSEVPGLVRVSFGIYNTLGDINRLIWALNNISEGKIINKYTIDKKLGTYTPEDCNIHMINSFML